LDTPSYVEADLVLMSIKIENKGLPSVKYWSTTTNIKINSVLSWSPCSRKPSYFQ